MIAYREFTRAGFDVHVFERDSLPGGNWHYTAEVPDKAPIPNAEISVGDYTPSLPPEDAMFPYKENYYDAEAREILRAHRAPKPVWASLQPNGPAVSVLSICSSLHLF
jgi:cation diffusion facilitator CzcD-associated flavoprotein CzcO